MLWSVVACGAILGGVVLPVTCQAGAHVVSDSALGHCCLCQISVARCAWDTRLVMGGMAKFHVSIRGKVVYALPRDLHVLFSVFDDLLHFGLVTRQLGVAQHAFFDGRNSGGIASVGSNMTVEAVEPELHVCIMRK